MLEIKIEITYKDILFVKPIVKRYCQKINNYYLSYNTTDSIDTDDIFNISTMYIKCKSYYYNQLIQLISDCNIIINLDVKQIFNKEYEKRIINYINTSNKWEQLKQLSPIVKSVDTTDSSKTEEEYFSSTTDDESVMSW